jgi:hypothetical protein
MRIYDSFIYFIIFIKLAYSIGYFTHLYFDFFDTQNKNGTIDQYAVYIRDFCEILFISCMSILMIFLFNPVYVVKQSLYINDHTQKLFFIFAIVLLFIVFQLIREKNLYGKIRNMFSKVVVTPTPSN